MFESPSRVVAVFAHPDDEIFCAGGTLAKWSREGADVTVVSATRGEAGQIRDAAVAVRATLGQVREQELRDACARLGVHHVVVLDYLDGTLHEVDEAELVAAVRAVLLELDPDVVITFGADGAYGHPDHIAIGEATVAAAVGLRAVVLRSHFPEGRISLAARLADWLVSREERFGGSLDYGRALTLFAEESTTMRFATDDVRVVWYPPGSSIVEQGEAATSLSLILSGEVAVYEDMPDGERIHRRNLHEGQFFGELGMAGNHARTASVIAIGNVTCLVLSRSKPTKFQGRGGGARHVGDQQQEADATHSVEVLAMDVTAFVEDKLAALAKHRSQYPIEVDVFPRPMLSDMYGIEYFVRVDAER